MVDSENRYVTVGNEYISISLDAETGVIRQIRNKIKDLSLMTGSLSGARLVPWRLGRQEENWVGKSGVFDLKATWVDEYESFELTSDGVEMANLTWKVNPDTLVEARIEVPKGDPNAYFYADVKTTEKETVRLEYPIVQGIGILGDDPERNYLAHPHATGVLYRNPFSQFKSEGRRPMSRMLSTDRGLPLSIYPDGYAGSTMQFMVYYTEDVGGFYMACHDGEANLKAINFYRNMDNLLEASFMHEKRDLSKPNLKPGYPVVIGSLWRGDWYEGAERYKEWAQKQMWCMKGPLWKRVKDGTASGWLVEGVGFCTFGINSKYDRSRWLRFFHDITGKPVFHILGVNWPKTEANYMGGMASTLETWFPAVFNHTNLKAVNENGDYFAPFEFDILMGGWGGWPESWIQEKIDEIKKNMLVVPRRFGYGVYSHGYLCPFTHFLRNLHILRDERLVKEYGADANYYDISFSNVLMACFNAEHGHPVGGGSWMVDAWRRLAKDTKEATTKAKGAYVPQGTEVIIEPLIGELDFYQARANASPCSPMEIDFWRDWIKQGKARKIPMFDFVYHEYGPVRLDGWAKISHEIGDLFYWIAGRTALWGGLFELNYEFSALEVVDGKHENTKEHYYRIRDRRYEVDSDKLEFIREIADARTGFAKDFLAYGTMIKPLKIQSGMIELNWFSYNSPVTVQSYEDGGALKVASVVHSAWKFRGNLGFVFLNLSDKHVKIKASVDPSGYELETSSLEAYIVDRDGERRVGVFNTEEILEVDLDLLSRRIVLLELRALGPQKRSTT